MATKTKHTQRLKQNKPELPKPSRERIWDEKRLREATITHCRECFAVRWPDKHTGLLPLYQTIDAKDREQEARARALLDRLEECFDEARVWQRDSTGKRGFAGVELEALLRAREELDPEPPDYPAPPSLGVWWRDHIWLARVFGPCEARDLAVLGVVAGYWPPRSVQRGESVAGAMRAITGVARKALNDWPVSRLTIS